MSAAWTLAELRNMAGLTQAQLAQRLGRHPSRVGMLEDKDPMTLALNVLQAYVGAIGGALHVSYVDPTGREVPLLWTEPTRAMPDQASPRGDR